MQAITWKTALENYFDPFSKENALWVRYFGILITNRGVNILYVDSIKCENDLDLMIVFLDGVFKGSILKLFELFLKLL